MAKLFRIFVGYRDDLDLSLKWWHRLASVVYAVLFLGVWVIASFLTNDDRTRRPRVSDIDILSTMTDVMLANDQNDRESHVEDFQAREGQDGLRVGSNVQPMYFYSGSVRCFVFRRTGNADGTKVENPKSETMCLQGDRDNPQALDTNNIIKYRLTSFGSLRLWFVSIGIGFLWAAGLSIPLLTFYYRGLVYIICGPRKRMDLTPV